MELSQTIKDLKRRRLSNSVYRIFASALAETSADGPVVTVTGFLRSAIAAKNTSHTAIRVAEELFATRLESLPSDAPTVPAGDDTRLSHGLWQAIEGARTLRARTGGNDQFIGIRYILFEILTSPERPLADDRDQLLRAVGIDESLAAHRIAKFCWDQRETPEKPEVWRQVFNEREVDPFSPPLVRAGVALLQADDPWLGEPRDHAGAEAEARAFAKTIVAAEFRPPLAVGVFGDWGSGKSFFMRLVHKAVEEQARQGGDGSSADSIAFLRNVVQVRFNAWHYVETNLWASLVENIFTCLDRWAETQEMQSAAEQAFERLATARRLTVEAAETLISRRRERNAAAADLQDAKTQLAAREAELRSRPSTYLQAAWRSLVGRGDAERERRKAEVRKAGLLLGLGDLAAGADEFRAAAAALDSELAKHAALRSGTVRALTAPAVVGAVALATVALPLALAWISELANANLPPLAAAVSGAVAPLALGLGWAARKTSAAVATLQEFRASLDEAVRAQAERGRDTEKSARDALAAAEAAALEAKERLAQAAELAATAAREYNAENGKGRVLSFVRERIATGEYAKQLSFIATVRKDFEELSRLMTTVEPDGTSAAAALHEAHVEKLIAQAREDLLLDPHEIEKLENTTSVGPADGPVFERIILYIDDLDRCPPREVVAVLQAIHLLLTFPLFVVFVAVDVRWLRHALTKQYEGQIRSEDDESAIATAGDYLEKIFQVPYWVRRMGPENTRAILEDRMGPADDGQSADAPATPPANREEDAIDAGSDAAPPPADGEQAKPDAVEGDRSLRLTANERAFIEKIAPALDGSPRRTLRFINTYRIIKASLSADQIGGLERRGYRAFATLLAIAVSADELYPAAVRALAASEPFDRLLLQHGAASALSRNNVAAALDCFALAGGTSEELQKYADLVGRFSFHPSAGTPAASFVQAPSPDQTIQAVSSAVTVASPGSEVN